MILLNQTETRFSITSGSCVISFKKDEELLYQTGINTMPFSAPVAAPLFHLALAGDYQGDNWALVHCYSNLPFRMRLVSCETDGHDLTAVFSAPDGRLGVTVRYQAVEAANGFRVTTEVKNNSGETIPLTYLSAGTANGIAADGSLPWNDREKLSLHYFKQTWQGEAQHRALSLEEAGIYYTCVHPGTASFSLTSRGSWTTGKYLPLLYAEDRETGKIWYAQYEPLGSWQMELDCLGSWTEDSPQLSFQAAGIAYELDGAYPLGPGETYSSEPIFIGCCPGGMDEAVRALTKYRRSCLPTGKSFADRPAFFNDYMNCLWARPSDEKLAPLIKRAAEAGAEGFCIDAGWYADPDQDWSALGDWEPCDARFGEGGLQKIIDMISGYGMKAGLWLELEMCTRTAALYHMPDDWFVYNYGSRVVGNGERVPLNFTNPAVRAHFHQVIDRLVGMGVSFFKNDYNMAVFLGDDSKTLPARSLKENLAAFYSFIDEAKERHPGLIIENCASGAMRQDYGALRHFDLQSVSDQEISTLMPAVLCGQLAAVLPEQLGVWSYPCPVPFLSLDRGEALFDDPAYLARLADGEDTIFNMVSGLCGTLYQSGRIDRADEKNFALIREGIAFFKQERRFLSEAYPCWPIGFAQIADKDSFICAAFTNEADSRALIYLWRREGEADTVKLPFARFKGKAAALKQVYPAADYEAPASYDPASGTVTVTLRQKNTARIFSLTAQ